MKKILLILFLIPIFSFGQVDLVRWNGSIDLLPTVLNSNIVASAIASSGVNSQQTAGYDDVLGRAFPVSNAIDRPNFTKSL